MPHSYHGAVERYGPTYTNTRTTPEWTTRYPITTTTTPEWTTRYPTTTPEWTTRRPVTREDTTARDESRDRGYYWSNTQTVRNEQPTWGTRNETTTDSWTPRTTDWTPRINEWTPRTTDWTPRTIDWTPRTNEWTPRTTDWTPRTTDWTPRTTDNWTPRNWEGRREWTTTPVYPPCPEEWHTQPHCGHGQWQTRQWSRDQDLVTRPQSYTTPECTQQNWEGPRENWTTPTTRPTTWTRDTPEWTTGRPQWRDTDTTTRNWTGDYTDNGRRGVQNWRTEGRWQGPRWI